MTRRKRRGGKMNKKPNATKAPKMTREMCSGCYDEFYWQQGGIDGKGCWSFDEKKKCIKQAKVHINSVPPWTEPLEWYPPCFKQSQFVMIDEGNPSLSKEDR